MSRSNSARKVRNLAVAVAVAVAVQILAFLGLVSGDHDDDPLMDEPAVQLVMLRPPPPPVPRPEEASKVKEQTRTPPPIASSSRIATVAPVVSGQAPGTGPADGAVAAAPPAPAERSVYLGCIGGTPLAKRPAEARYKCEEELGLAARRRGRHLEAAMADDKRAGFDAAAARQAYRRAPVSQLGNGSSMGCAHSNLGVGCPDDMLIPLVKKKF